jgi:F420-dependent oxidoreductase-like protein
VELRIFTEPQSGATYDDQLAVARLTEELGFDAFFRSDHYIDFGEGDGLPGPTDAWIALAGLARETSRIRLGTLVSPVTFRLPGPLAISVAQVDAMSSGRVELGLGAGWNDVEHRAYGIPFPPTSVRFAMLEEQLAIISGLWSTPVGERFSFDGEHYQLADSPALPKPVQRPGPPIVMGGWGTKRTPRLAARYAAEFNVPFAPPEAFGGQVANVRAACEADGRDPSSMVFSVATVVCCGAEESVLERRAKKIGQPLDQLRKTAAAGTPDEVIAQLRRFADDGATRAYLQVLDMADHDQLHLLGEAVLPEVARW